MLSDFPLFAEDVQSAGPPAEAQPLSEDRLVSLERKLPAAFLAFLATYGLGDYKNRAIQYVDPDKFSSILGLVFKDDKDFSSQGCHIVSYSAFGTLNGWSSHHNDTFKIDLLQGTLSCEAVAPSILPSIEGFNDDLADLNISTDPNILCRTLVPFTDDESHEVYDLFDEPLFRPSIRQYGSLQRGECFGFFPALRMGGLAKLENIRRVKAFEHFSILAQLEPFKLVRMNEHYSEVQVRQIG